MPDPRPQVISPDSKEPIREQRRELVLMWLRNQNLHELAIVDNLNSQNWPAICLRLKQGLKQQEHLLRSIMDSVDNPSELQRVRYAIKVLRGTVLKHPPFDQSGPIRTEVLRIRTAMRQALESLGVSAELWAGLESDSEQPYAAPGDDEDTSDPDTFDFDTLEE